MSAAGPVYRVRLLLDAPAVLDPSVAPDSDPTWRDAEVATIQHYHSASSQHRPRVRARLASVGHTLFVRFDVNDRFVRCVHREPQSMVCEDSCVEIFLEPPGGGDGYFNLEMNCGGAFLLYHITDPRPHPERLLDSFGEVHPEATRLLTIRSTLPPLIEPERAEPTDWSLIAAVPIAVLASRVPSLRTYSGRWRGNLFKCGDKTSHPHWAAWSCIGSELRFHQPDRFGVFEFD
jgi:hypothetical protein